MTILLTGATSGIGLEAARLLLAKGETLLVGARDPYNLPEALAGHIEAYPLDLASLASVRRFTESVLPRGPFKALVLNAGMQTGKIAKTEDGFERTFAINHLAHFLLLNLLIDQLGEGGRVVITGSGAHDPAEKIPFPPPPHHADAERLAYPEKDTQRDKFERMAGARAYSASKLANVMTIRELGRRRPDIGSIAFDPAYVPKTSLGREAPALIVKAYERILPLLLAKDRWSTVPKSGSALARLATDPTYSEERGAYWSMRGEAMRTEPSELARDDEAAARLWEDSERLVR